MAAQPFGSCTTEVPTGGSSLIAAQLGGGSTTAKPGICIEWRDDVIALHLSQFNYCPSCGSSFRSYLSSAVVLHISDCLLNFLRRKNHVDESSDKGSGYDDQDKGFSTNAQTASIGTAAIDRKGTACQAHTGAPHSAAVCANCALAENEMTEKSAKRNAGLKCGSCDKVYAREPFLDRHRFFCEATVNLSEYMNRSTNSRRNEEYDNGLENEEFVSHENYKKEWSEESLRVPCLPDIAEYTPVRSPAQVIGDSSPVNISGMAIYAASAPIYTSSPALNNTCTPGNEGKMTEHESTHRKNLDGEGPVPTNLDPGKSKLSKRRTHLRKNHVVKNCADNVVGEHESVEIAGEEHDALEIVCEEHDGLEIVCEEHESFEIARGEHEGWVIPTGEQECTEIAGGEEECMDIAGEEQEGVEIARGEQQYVQNASGMQECFICNKRFKKPSYLRRHLELTHGGVKTEQCRFCPSTFKDRTTLKNHERSHTNERPFACTQCNKTFRRKESLLYHENSHKNSRPFICSQCGKAFRNLRDMKAHEKVLHSTKESGESGGQALCRIQCKLCDAKFQSRSALANHRALKHRGVVLHCAQCDKQFTSTSQLEIHYRTHSGNKPFQCEYCPKTFRRGSHKALHEKRHSSSGQFMCELCNKRFPQESELRKHKQVHSSKIKCEVCRKSFPRENLREHMLKHHFIQCIDSEVEPQPTLLQTITVKTEKFKTMDDTVTTKTVYVMEPDVPGGSSPTSIITGSSSLLGPHYSLGVPQFRSDKEVGATIVIPASGRSLSEYTLAEHKVSSSTQLPEFKLQPEGYFRL